jgi:catechol 2,3-dioxygenase-like lactoylglutathione lyase family enzyme
VDYKLEVVIVPVADIDRAKAFYSEKVGFGVDVDMSAGPEFRVVQLTPPGSACSIAFVSSTEMAPGTIQGLHLIVADIEAAHADLAGRGVEVGEIFHFAEGGQHPGPHPERAKYGSYLAFSDPDGNGWLVQEA